MHQLDHDLTRDDSARAFARTHAFAPTGAAKAGANQAERATHLAAVDLVHVLGACGIVWFHADHATLMRGVGYAGLPAFVFLSGYLLARNAPRRPWPALCRGRARRLALPFVAWSLAYGMLALLRGEPTPFGADALDVLAGTSLHLWYLPFVLLVTVPLSALAKRAQYARRPGTLPALLLATGLLALALEPTDADLWRAPLSQWLFALPAVCMGAALGCAPDAVTRRRQALVLVPGVLVLASLRSGVEPVDALAYALGVPAALAATFAPATTLSLATTLGPARSLLARLAELTLGVYLMHPLMLQESERLGAQSVPERVAFAVLAAACCTALLRRSAWGRLVT